MSQHATFFSRVAWICCLAGSLAAPVQGQSRVGSQLPAEGLTLASRASVTQAVPSGPVRRISIDDAVELALRQNLSIRVDRLNPQIDDLSIAQARAAWAPSISTTFSSNERDSPANSFLSGADNATTQGQFSTAVNYNQAFSWGGSTAVSWDSSRTTTNNFFANFNPQLQSSFAFQYAQPLLRNRTIDSARQQLLVSQKNREISDVQLRQTVVNTTRSVKNAYWDLAYASASLDVNQQSLDLARRSLRDTRARVEIGTMAPIDIVEVEAEVAQREEAVIVAEASIAQAEDWLKSLILDPSMPGFWSVRLELTDVAPFQLQTIDLDSAVQNALSLRTDLRQARKSLESSNINLRYAQNQTLPDLNLQINYGMMALGGTQLVRGPSQGFLGPVIGEVSRGYGSVLGDLFQSDFPNWTVSLTVGYPLGQSSEKANLARSRVQHNQSQIQIENVELQVATQVRDAARQVNTNAKRVETTRVARQLNERRLEAEEKKFGAGTSTSFFVFQAQRDLAQSQNNELRAILDYNKSLVDFETVQESALGSGGGITVATNGPSLGTGGVAQGVTEIGQDQPQF